MKRVFGLGVGLLSLAGCEDVIDLDPVDERPVVEARVRPKPIIGGTLTLTQDGLAVAADPDRDLVHVVDIEAQKVRHTIALDPGDEPGRVVEGRAGWAHVVLRGSGGVASIDLSAGTVASRQWLCPDPRGIDYDASDSSLHVACADGTLVQVDEGSGAELDRIVLEPDLRDVVLLDGVRYTSRFRSAWVGTDADSKVFRPVPSIHESNVAWRTWDLGDGHLAMLHQASQTDPVPLTPGGGGGDDGLGGGGDLPYGGGGGDCNPGIGHPVLTMFEPDGELEFLSTPLLSAPLTVDAAIQLDPGLIVLAMPGAPEGDATLAFAPLGGGCGVQPISDAGQFTAVAVADDGTVVAQSREPALLAIKSQILSPDAPILVELQGESRYDTGHEIFHRATESGLSCASCHPEGGDDGHVWNFEGLGARRTQPLDVGLEGTAPFHWDGDMSDLDMIMDEVLSHRMGGHRQSAPRRDSFAQWMFEQQRPPADGDVDAALAEEGKALFAAYKCNSCHAGDKLGAATAGTIHGKELQVPSLRRVSLRPPFMHDGRSATLEEATLDMIEATTQIESSPHDIEAIAAYMRTL